MVVITSLIHPTQWLKISHYMLQNREPYKTITHCVHLALLFTKTRTLHPVIAPLQPKRRKIVTQFFPPTA